MVAPKANPQTSEMYLFDELRDCGWPRWQMKTLRPDLVLPDDPDRAHSRTQRFWKRTRIELIEPQPDWPQRRRKLDAKILAEHGRDQAAARAERLKAREGSKAIGRSWPSVVGTNGGPSSAYLKIAGVQQAHKEDKIIFTSLAPWPGEYICAEGRYTEADGSEKCAGIFIGPEFGTVTREDLVAAAREAGDAVFHVLIACAFSYDAHSAEMNKLGRIRVLKARMNADLHMAEDLKNTGKGNLFVIFGEPDIEIQDEGSGQVKVKVGGGDVFHPSTGEVRSNGPDEIACWFIDTDYNEESFFVRHAYFLGANDPYKALKTTLKAEIDEDAWASLRSDTSRAFDKSESRRIAVKVINHLGDEVMKVFRVTP
jgi:hypothetical protein